jgi:FkbM family methyltransferase
VPSITLDEIIGPPEKRQVLKIDIEGAEHAVLRGSSRLRDIDLIVGEYHPVSGES